MPWEGGTGAVLGGAGGTEAGRRRGRSWRRGPVTSSFPNTQWWLMGNSEDPVPSRRSLCPTARACVWGCSFPVPPSSVLLGTVFALCECQQGQMFASGGRAGQGYMGPLVGSPEVPAARWRDESFGEAVVIWGEPVRLSVPPSLVPLPVPHSTPWPQAVRLDTGGLCSAT